MEPPVAIVTLVVGSLLSALGILGYLLSEPRSLTALIPLAFGFVLEACGALALRPQYRKHAMHVASVLALLGVLGSASGAFTYLTTFFGATVERPLAVQFQGLMFVVCAVFLVLCIRSFRQARLRREAAGAA
jgi:uncharacterized membrane protein